MRSVGRHVLFDCDGVLADTEGATARALSDALAGVGVALAVDFVRATLVGKTWAAVNDEVLHGWGISLGRSFWLEYRERQVSLIRAKIRPDVTCSAMLDTLVRCGWGLAVLSDSSEDRVRLVLELRGVAKFFGKHVYCADTLGTNKTDFTTFRTVADRLSADLGKSVLVDDRDLPIASARKAGMAGIKYTGFAAPAPVTPRDPQIAVAESYDRLVTLLR